MRLGYFLSSEEHPPEELLRQAKLAERAGFESLWISDHFHPWNDEQGESPFVWSVIGALSQVTALPVTTAVTCPTVRTHPAVVAQAVATAARMLPGGLHFGVGSGEALNEHVVGQRWPTADVRLEMLEEAIGVIRRLLTGERVDHHGQHYTVEDARIYTLPERRVPILVSGFGPKAIELAARAGDGLVTTKPDKNDIAAYHGNGGRGSVEAGVKVCWGESADQAAELAHRLWATQGLPGELSQVLPSPRHFEQGAQLVRVEDTREAIACGPDPKRYADVVGQYADAGVDVLHIAQIGPDQEGFFDFFTKEVRPLLAKQLGPTLTGR
jgi:G6PDH family F420-dependent oxidoreductase